MLLSAASDSSLAIAGGRADSPSAELPPEEVLLEESDSPPHPPARRARRRARVNTATAGLGELRRFELAVAEAKADHLVVGEGGVVGELDDVGLSLRLVPR